MKAVWWCLSLLLKPHNYLKRQFTMNTFFAHRQTSHWLNWVKHHPAPYKAWQLHISLQNSCLLQGELTSLCMSEFVSQSCIDKCLCLSRVPLYCNPSAFNFYIPDVCVYIYLYVCIHTEVYIQCTNIQYFPSEKKNRRLFLIVPINWKFSECQGMDRLKNIFSKIIFLILIFFIFFSALVA